MTGGSMLRTAVRVLVLAAALRAGTASFAQATGSAGITAGSLESGGPDVLHQREGSYEGPALFGALSSFGKGASLQLDWNGVGTPDFHLRGVSYWSGLALEASVDQRAYLAASNARFAWDPWDGTLDARVPAALGRYRPYGASPVGHFDPATIPAARGLLPESAPGWAMRDYVVELRSRGRERGFALTLTANEREGLMPRTFVTATGFAPSLSALTQGLPIGRPFGSVEVPERFRERSCAIALMGFITAGTWRWEGQASFGRFESKKLTTYFASPFPGPPVDEAPPFWGGVGRVRFSGRGAHGYVTLEGSRSEGRGDAGERTYGTLKLEAGYSNAFKGKTAWFVEGRAFDFRDTVTIGPQGLSAVYRGPYYSLLGPIPAGAPVRTDPMQSLDAEGGFRGPRWEASGRLLHLRQPEAYARRLDTLSAKLAFAPWRGLKVEVRPSWTWAGAIGPGADSLDGLEQAANFRPSNARDFSGVDVSAEYRAGPLLLRYLLGTYTSSPDAGLTRRDRQEALASFFEAMGPWSLRASARAATSYLALSGTTYALPGEALDPVDPTHRYPIGDEWRRRGSSGCWRLERALSKTVAAGWAGRWEYDRLSTHRRLDDPRSYHYWRTGLYIQQEIGPLDYRVEAGAECYRASDPAFEAAGVPPGPYLWTGLTERPGTRGFVALQLAYRF
jgi:hypothetical protein